MTGKCRSLDDDPAFIDLRNRILNLEAKVAKLEEGMDWVKKALGKIENMDNPFRRCCSRVGSDFNPNLMIWEIGLKA